MQITVFCYCCTEPSPIRLGGDFGKQLRDDVYSHTSTNKEKKYNFVMSRYDLKKSRKFSFINSSRLNVPAIGGAYYLCVLLALPSQINLLMMQVALRTCQKTDDRLLSFQQLYACSRNKRAADARFLGSLSYKKYHTNPKKKYGRPAVL